MADIDEVLRALERERTARALKRSKEATRQERRLKLLLALMIVINIMAGLALCYLRN